MDALFLDTLFLTGQALAATLLLFGAGLSLLQALAGRRRVPWLDAATEDQLLLVRHLHFDV
jgi:hypothetical protein